MKHVPILCLLLGVSYCSYGQLQVDGSFLNVTRPTGGPIATGDILQIRSVLAVPKNTNLTNLYYTSTVPTGTSYVSGSLQVLTNEGVVNPSIATTGSYTDGSGDDAGQYTAGTGAININMGTGAGKAAATGGSITGGVTTPVFQTSATILVTAYKVKVTGAVGSTITLTGTFHYRNGTNQTKAVPASTLLVSTPYTCSNTGSTNYVTDESGGTFGSSNTQNRSTSSADVTGYTFTNISTSSPADGAYSIINSTAGDASNDKVWGVWDIIGDHSGTSSSAGNPAAPIGNTGGYLLAINATYTPATVFTTTINGLTANSTYTIAFWTYNLCPACGNDPITGLATTTPGVLPNIAIFMNGNGVYSSGNLGYMGQWVKNSFTFNVGSATTATLAINNNAPGGGGNDWAIDDISMTQCLVVLPLELSSFSAHVVASAGSAGLSGGPGAAGSAGSGGASGSSGSAGAVQLSWTTASENGVGSFDVQRSVDGVNFVTVGHVAGTGSVTGSSYTYTDSGLSGQVWYRLMLTDGNGVVSYSSIVVVDGAAGDLTVRLAPNPSSSGSAVNLLVNVPTAQPAQIGVWSLAGAPLYRQDVALVAGANSLIVRPRMVLPPGVYVVKVVLSSGTICTKWIIFGHG